ncbi:hypothetical protein PG988_016050 [Apiospora saccharicola]
MENSTDSFIHVESSEEGFAQFDAVTSDPGQQARIQKIHLEVLLHATSVKRLKKMQSNAETAANNAAFTRATADFFGRLATWGPRSPGSGIKLTVTTRSLNLALIQELVASGELDQAHNEFSPPIWDVRHSYRYIQFTPDAPPLPKVACVSELDVGKEYHFHPSVLLALSSSLDQLERLEWRLRLPGRRQASERREIRSALAHALQHVDFPPTLATLEMYLGDEDPGNEHFDPGSFGEENEDADDRDDLSLATHEPPGTPLSFPPTLVRRLREDDTGRPVDDVGDPEAGIEEDGYCDSDAEEEEPAAFDSDDSDTSDYAPEFAWDKEDGLVPGVWFRFRPEPPYYAALLQSFVEGAVHGGMPSLRSFAVNFGKNSRAPLELKYSSQVDDEGNGPCWDISAGRDFDRSWEMPPELRRSLQGPDGNIGLRGDFVNQPTEGLDP